MSAPWPKSCWVEITSTACWKRYYEFQHLVILMCEMHGWKIYDGR
ncbi:hypothetical protein ACTMTJ_30175 [Phytohabitans sp. LJ34]